MEEVDGRRLTDHGLVAVPALELIERSAGYERNAHGLEVAAVHRGVELQRWKLAGVRRIVLDPERALVDAMLLERQPRCKAHRLDAGKLSRALGEPRVKAHDVRIAGVSG